MLAAATDGVGTKLEIARAAGRLDTVGIDLVAMCADDVVCTGAEPLFFLDYLAVGRVVPERVAALVEGVAEGCRRAGCALLGRRDRRTSRRDARRPVRPGGVLRRGGGRGRSAGAGSRPGGRRADRAGVHRTPRQRLLPGAQGPRSLRPRRTPRRARAAARRRAAGALRDRRAAWSCRWRATGCSTPRPTSRAAGSTRTSRARCPRAWARRSTGAPGRSTPIFALVQAAAGASRRRHVLHVQHGRGDGPRRRSVGCRRGAGGATTLVPSRSAASSPGAGVSIT